MQIENFKGAEAPSVTVTSGYSCKECGNPFTPHNKDQKFCSKQCAGKARRQPLAERFSEKFEVTPICWNWKNATDKDGYGVIAYGGKTYKAHRLAYIATNGKIPEKNVVMHICDNPSCVRPDHLKAGTQAENLADMRRKGRNSRKLEDEDVEFIRETRLFSPRELAESYNVSLTTIYGIRHGTYRTNINLF